MRREYALLPTAAAAIVFVSITFANSVYAQSVGSGRKSPPGSTAARYDSKGRLFWDANGQIVGRYNFHTKQYEPINQPPPVVPANSTESNRNTRPRPRYRERKPTPPLAIVFRGPTGSHGRNSAGSGQRGPKVITAGNYAQGSIVRHQRLPIIPPNFVQAPSPKTTLVP